MEYSDRKMLQAAGFEVNKRDAIALSYGSETLRHLVCKALVVKHLRGLGYRVDSEVQMERGGRVDVIGEIKKQIATNVEIAAYRGTNEAMEKYV